MAYVENYYSDHKSRWIKLIVTGFVKHLEQHLNATHTMAYLFLLKRDFY